MPQPILSDEQRATGRRLLEDEKRKREHYLDLCEQSRVMENNSNPFETHGDDFWELRDKIDAALDEWSAAQRQREEFFYPILVSEA